MARGISRKQLKQDEFVEAAWSFEHWLEENWKLVAQWAAGIAAVGLLIGAFFWWNQNRIAAAQALLAEGMEHFQTAGSAEGSAADYEKALAAFEQAAAKGGEASDTAIYFQGVALARLGRHDEAAAKLQKAVSAAATDEAADAARVARADALVAAGQSEEGLAALQTLADGESAYAGYALYRLAGIHDEQGDATRARELYQSLLDRFPNDPLSVDARSKVQDAGAQ